MTNSQLQEIMNISQNWKTFGYAEMNISMSDGDEISFTAQKCWHSEDEFTSEIEFIESEDSYCCHTEHESGEIKTAPICAVVNLEDWCEEICQIGDEEDLGDFTNPITGIII